MPHAKEPALVSSLFTALLVWPLNRLDLPAVCQQVIRAMWTPALSVGMIAPLVFAGAVGAAAPAPPQAPAPTRVWRGAAVTPVAAVMAQQSGPSGPAMVAVARP